MPEDDRYDSPMACCSSVGHFMLPVLHGTSKFRISSMASGGGGGGFSISSWETPELLRTPPDSLGNY